MTHPGTSTSDDDLFLLCMLGFGGLLAAAGSAAAWWSQLVAWLLERHVLVSSEQRPLLVLPHAAGVGLDLPRAALAAAVLLFLLAATAGAVRRHFRTGELR